MVASLGVVRLLRRLAIMKDFVPERARGLREALG